VCEANDIGLLSLRQYGLFGSLRVFKKEVCVTESKPDMLSIDDLRITNPFPALLVRNELQTFKDYANSINFEALDSAEHGHLPFNIILIRSVEAWKATVRLAVLERYSMMESYPRPQPRRNSSRLRSELSLETFRRSKTSRRRLTT